MIKNFRVSEFPDTHKSVAGARSPSADIWLAYRLCSGDRSLTPKEVRCAERVEGKLPASSNQELEESLANREKAIREFHESLASCYAPTG